MKLPTNAECLNYFEEYKVPSNIKNHCLKVKEVAVFLAHQLNHNGILVNVDLVERAALMHDLFKMVTITDFGNDEHHDNSIITEEQMEFWSEFRKKYQDMWESDVAYEIYKDEFPELALVIKNSSNPKKTDKTWEELIVHYADWRVFKEEVIQLIDRLAYFRKKYPKPGDVWLNYEEIVYEQEKKLFVHLNFKPEDLSIEIEKKRQ